MYKREMSCVMNLTFAGGGGRGGGGSRRVLFVFTATLIKTSEIAYFALGKTAISKYNMYRVS